MRTIHVNASKNYDICIDNSFDNFYDIASNVIIGNNLVFITDENLYNLYYDEINTIYPGRKISFCVIEPGEESKNIDNYSNILNNLVELSITRDDTIITFGGGVVGDLGGFIASTYIRGINLIHIPTSLLSMVDSSVGGKTAINLDGGKNLCGTFYQPSLVYINTSLLNTLPEIEKLNGFGEVVKYYFLDNINLTFDISEDLIYDCLKVKTKIVEEDEKESSKRKLLNFGHTFGHAIEKLYNFKVGHGLCVVKGIYLSLLVSKYLFNEGNSLLIEFLTICDKYNYDLDIPFTVDDVIDEVMVDKKRKFDSIDFVAINNEKIPTIINIDIERLKEILDEIFTVSK